MLGCDKLFPMNYIILLFGFLILLSGALILVRPETIFGLIRSNSESLGLHILAVVVRLILGIALITYAAESKFPFFLQLIGWLSLTAAIILGVIGRSRFKGLIEWALRLSSSLGHFAGLLAVLIGALLIYAVV